MPIREGSVMLVAGDGLGRGDEDLGRLLMQRFLHELGGAASSPERILFINRGVYLVADDSLVLDQLQRLQDQGVELEACSTCLTRFNLMERVAIGSRTNMSEIVSALVTADRVISF